jgi:SAM-dependent methyltransferase
VTPRVGRRDPTVRFDDRAEAYARHRPGYPPAALDWLAESLPLRPGERVADVGCGTGLFARLLLAHGVTVLGVEPSAPMRAEAQRDLGAEPRFGVRPGTAESLPLRDRSADVVACAQAFHWFHPARARREFRRVLADPPRVVLVWNHRATDDSFTAGYGDLVTRAKRPDDAARIHLVDAATDAATRAWYGPAGCRHATFLHGQRLDWEGLEGRARSTSYLPLPGEPGYETFHAGLRALFDAFARDGTVTLRYETHVYAGVLSE